MATGYCWPARAAAAWRSICEGWGCELSAKPKANRDKTSRLIVGSRSLCEEPWFHPARDLKTLYTLWPPAQSPARNTGTSPPDTCWLVLQNRRILSRRRLPIGQQPSERTGQSHTILPHP